MAFPEHADYVIIGAGIHGISTAWKLAERMIEKGEEVEGRPRKHQQPERPTSQPGNGNPAPRELWPRDTYAITRRRRSRD